MKITGINSHLSSNQPSGLSDARNVANEFESIFSGMLIKAMRKTVPDGGLLPKNISTDIYTSMLDDEYGRLLSKHASLGLSDLLVKEMEREGNSNSAQAALKQSLPSSMFLEPRFAPQHMNSYLSQPLEQRVDPWWDTINEASQKFDLDKNLIAAVLAQESAGNPYAVSHAGAKGLMQLIDTTARSVGVSNPFDPVQNIMGGSRYLSEMLQQFNHDEKKALAAYNAGPTAVKKHNGIPPYRETQDYVNRVLDYRGRFSRMNRK